MTVEDLCALLPRSTIIRLMAIEGPLVRTLLDHPPGRALIRRFTHGGVGRMGVRLGRRLRLLEGRKPVELSLSVLRYFFEPLLEEVKETEAEAVFCLARCPYGWRAPDDAPLCDAVMQLERELVAGLGGELVIEERIPEGAEKCRFTLRAVRTGSWARHGRTSR